MPYTTEMIFFHQVTEAMVDLLTYAQWQRIRFAAERGGFDAGLRAMARVSREIAAEKIAAANDAAFQQGRLIGLQMALDVRATPAAITRIAVVSSTIKSIGFRQCSARAGTLEIEFLTGAVYQYDDVLTGVYHDLMDAPSKGQYFSRYIRNGSPARKIADAV